MNSLVTKDLLELKSIFKFEKQLHNKSILVTGGTGLIGSLILKFLDLLNENNANIIVYGMARNKEKAEKIEVSDSVNWIYQRMEEDLPDIHFDFIIHTACPTQSSFLANNPVEVINTSVNGAMNIFEYAKKHSSSVVFLSSVEVYGQKYDEDKTIESDYGYINHLMPRNCYPESKQLIECLASSYANEYGTDIKIARLTQTFGVGVNENDNRVFAQFARSVINNEDIVLHTKGESSKSYVYTVDAINGLFYILLKGEKGTAYNIANEKSYISIYDLAVFMKENFNDMINVKIELDSTKGYAPTTKVNLDTSELRKLGWNATVDLKEMFSRLVQYMEQYN